MGCLGGEQPSGVARVHVGAEAAPTQVAIAGTAAGRDYACVGAHQN